VTAELASVFRSAVERAGLGFEVDCPALPEPVYVDRDMWEKVVLNLLSNALKFTFEGSIRVAVRAEPGQAVVTVADTGIGVPESEAPLLFERFHRIENARSRSNEGSGIGLALVKELVELHGGTIAAASRENVGTTFTVRLPLGDAHLPQDALVARETPPRSRPPRSRSSRRPRAGFRRTRPTRTPTPKPPDAGRPTGRTARCPRRSSSPTTTPTCARTSPACCAGPATTSPWSTTGSTRWRRPARRRPT
jgi:hypothetical protein